MNRKKLILTLLLVLGLCLCLSQTALALKDIEIPEDAESVDLNDLRYLSERDIPQLTEILNAHSSLRSCDMSKITMSARMAASLAEGCPGITFHLVPTVNKTKIDNQLELLDLDGMNLSRKVSLVTLQQLLTCMPNLKEVNMVDARHEVSDMEALFAAFPQVTFHWTVRCNRMTFQPGATAYSTLKGRQEPRYTAEDMAPVIHWCPDLLALDVGHNNVSDLSFLSAWPNLRRLIVVDSKVPVTDLSPLADLKDLEYVELFMQNITDLSPLSGHTKLLDLNLCHNDITDLTPLYSCVNLERLWISCNNHLSQEEIDAFKAALPNCQVETESWQSTGAGWREHPRYFIMYESFTSGTYIPFEEEAAGPEITEAPAVTVTETPAPELTESPAAKATESPAAKATETPAGKMTETSAPKATETPAAKMTETSAPKATETPGAKATETPAAKATETPAARATVTPLPTTGIPATDITKLCLYNGYPGDSHDLTDGTYARAMKTGLRDGVRGLQVTAPEGIRIGALYIQWDGDPAPLFIQGRDQNGEWKTVSECDADFFAQYIPIPELQDLRILNRDDPTTALCICEMKVLTPGDPPDYVQLWQKPGDKVDMMLMVGHPDDELLWFGGLLPYYGCEREKDVLVVCAAMNRSLRRLELLDALWACGIRIHPVYSQLRDFVSGDPKEVLKTWGGEEKCQELFTGYIRQYKPDVLVLHDVKGEYGHGIHKTVSYLGSTGAENAGDASVFPEQAASLGTWDVPKVYIHLYPENQITMDWQVSLKKFGGKTALEVAAEAMLWHKSQLSHGWAVTAGGDMDNSLFGLYRTLVGPDREKTDMFENLPSR